MFLFKEDFIFFSSSFDIIEPLYNILSEAKGKDSNFTPSYNVLINGKYFSFLFNPKSSLISLN